MPKVPGSVGHSLEACVFVWVAQGDERFPDGGDGGDVGDGALHRARSLGQRGAGREDQDKSAAGHRQEYDARGWQVVTVAPIHRYN